MEKVTFLESILKILKSIVSIPFLIEILILTFLMLAIMIFFYFKKNKFGKNTAIIIYFVSLILLPITHFDFFINGFDKIVENFLKVLYFPSWYLYLFIILYSDIDVLRLIIKSLKSEIRSLFTVFSIIYFFLIQFLFFLLVYTASKNNINVFDSNELFLNTLCISIIQISSYLFWFRIFVNLFIIAVNKISKFEKKNMNIVNKDNFENSDKDIVQKNNIEYNSTTDNGFSNVVESSSLVYNDNNNNNNNDDSISKNTNIIDFNNLTEKTNEINVDINKNNNLSNNNLNNDVIIDLDSAEDKNYYDDFYE